MTSICFPPSAFCFLSSADCQLHLGSAGAGQEPAPWSLSPGNVFGLNCFESICRLSG
jgi:hypothetical protein